MLFAAALTLLSVRIQRVGPERAVVGNLCGPTASEACYAPVVEGGFPFAYLGDVPTVSRPNQLAFVEDDFRPGAFALDVAAYLLALLAIHGAAARRSRRRARRAG